VDLSVNENSPLALVTVPCVVFCANTLAPAKGSRETESTILPEIVTWAIAGTVMANMMRVRKIDIGFIE
jgi:hypothetical protein